MVVKCRTATLHHYTIGVGFIGKFQLNMEVLPAVSLSYQALNFRISPKESQSPFL